MTKVSIKGIVEGAIEIEIDEPKAIFYLTSYQNGFVTLIPTLGVSFDKTVEAVVSLFNSDIYGINQVEFSFNGRKIVINSENLDVKKITKLYLDGIYGNNVDGKNVKFKNEKAKETWLELGFKSSSRAERDILSYAQRWAELMQIEIDKGKSLEEIATITSNIASENYDLSGYGLWYATTLLAEVWKYGEELKVCYNKNRKMIK